MFRRFACALVAVLWLPTPTGAQLRDLVGVATQARVVGVIDGDTIDAIPTGEKRAIRVRLDGIDTPERGEPFSDVARRLTRVLVFDQTVTMRGTAVDKYGRLVARIATRDGDVSLTIVRAGLACHFTRYSSDATLAAAAAQARRTGQGFWAVGATLPRCTRGPNAALAPPQNERTPATQASSGTSGTRTPAARQSATTDAAAEHKVLHGNTSSHVYHTASCRNFHCLRCTQVFRTDEEARAAGYRPAGDCR